MKRRNRVLGKFEIAQLVRKSFELSGRFVQTEKLEPVEPIDID
jgi:hypothetical protein